MFALAVATPALAQTPSQAELADLVRAQAAEIVLLKARLDRMEGAQQAAVAAAQIPVTPPPQVAQAAPVPRVTVPFAPQLAPPGPAERSIAQATASRDNPSGVTTEWGAGLQVFHSADGV